MFSYDLNSRCAAATRISVMAWDVALRQMLSVFNGGLCSSFSIWKGCSIARGKLQPRKMGCPEEEHVGFFVGFPVAGHCGYFTPSSEVETQQGNACQLSDSWWFKVRESKTTLVPEVIRIVRCSKKHVPLSNSHLPVCMPRCLGFCFDGMYFSVLIFTSGYASFIWRIKWPSYAVISWNSSYLENPQIGAFII